jgi:hypothetical protein
VSADETDAASRRDLVRGLLTLASIEAQRGELESAGARLQSANTQIGMLLRSEPTNRDTRQLAIRAEVCAALIAAARDPAAAAEPYRRALLGIERDFPSSLDPEVLSLEAKALAGTGRTDEAREVENQLALIGFAGAASL